MGRRKDQDLYFFIILTWAPILDYTVILATLVTSFNKWRRRWTFSPLLCCSSDFTFIRRAFLLFNSRFLSTCHITSPCTSTSKQDPVFFRFFGSSFSMSAVLSRQSWYFALSLTSSFPFFFLFALYSFTSLRTNQYLRERGYIYCIERGLKDPKVNIQVSTVRLVLVPKESQERKWNWLEQLWKTTMPDVSACLEQCQPKIESRQKSISHWNRLLVLFDWVITVRSTTMVTWQIGLTVAGSWSFIVRQKK